MKEKNIFQMDYYQTYHFAHVCNAVLENPLEYIRILDEFWGNNNIQYFFPPFNKYSNLHMFIEFSIDRLFYESNKQFDELSIEELLNKDFFINDALNYHNTKHESFKIGIRILNILIVIQMILCIDI